MGASFPILVLDILLCKSAELMGLLVLQNGESAKYAVGANFLFKIYI